MINAKAFRVIHLTFYSKHLKKQELQYLKLKKDIGAFSIFEWFSFFPM